MKKHILAAVAALTLTVPAFAQTAPTTPTAPTAAQTAQQPQKALTIEERVAALEKVVNAQGQVLQELLKVAPQLVDGYRGLANNVVSLQDQITAIRRSAIPAPKLLPAKKAAAKPLAKK